CNIAFAEASILCNLELREIDISGNFDHTPLSLNGKLIDNLDKKAEISYLSLVSILREEEVRLFQRAKDDGRSCIADEEELKKHIRAITKLYLNEILTAIFTIDEVKKAVFNMEHNKAPGLDGFPAEFYQVGYYPSRIHPKITEKKTLKRLIINERGKLVPWNFIYVDDMSAYLYDNVVTITQK
ncbi:hypothetical protein ACJX0J_017074, partial [Zea mays]